MLWAAAVVAGMMRAAVGGGGDAAGMMLDGAFCCGSVSLGGGLVGSAMPRNSASLRGAARRRLNDATKKIVEAAIFCGRLGHASAIGLFRMEATQQNKCGG